MNAIIPHDQIELDPIEIDPRPCGLCGCTIDQHERVDTPEGPEFFCFPDDDIVTRWELADPRDRWKHTGEPPPKASDRSTARPAGIWAARYTATCTKTNAESAPGVIANRLAASSPAMPNVVRCMTAST